MTPDSELLATFARTNSEDAFAEVVKRHVGLVYSAALRQVGGDEHMAKDVAQTVFTDLAKKSAQLARRENLSGWLYTSAHFAAAKIVRTETRRRDREEKFMRESETSGTGVPPVQSASELAEWQSLSASLDDVMHDLKEADRDAILLRYFENRPFAEVGAKLGLNENAARMRVERALEKLRAAFAKRGIATTAGCAAAISANAIQMTPAGLTTVLTTTAITSAGAGTFTLLKIMTATKIKIGLATLVVAGGAAAIVTQHQAQDKLRGENTALQTQIAQLRTESQNLSNQLATAADPKKLPEEQFKELLKLRGEVGVLRRQVDEFKKSEQARAATERDAKQLLAAQQSELATSLAKAKFRADEIRKINNVKQICLAFRIVAGDHNNQFPTNINEDVMNVLGSTNLIGFAQNEIELLNQSVADPSSHPQMIQVRERNPRQDLDGKWKRIYGLVDGSVQTAASDDGNFDAWEKQNTEMPAANQ